MASPSAESTKSRRDAVLLVCVAAAAGAVFIVEAIAWPVQRGRDLWDYLVFYLSFLDGTTPFPLVMLVRTPVAPFVLGPAAELGGATGLEVLGGLLYVITVVAWTAAALTYSRVGAVVTAMVVLAYVPFALPFHEPSSDMVAAAGFALLCLGVVRTLGRPSARRFAAVGGGVAALALVRPSYQVLLVLLFAPLAIHTSWRQRLRFSGAFAAAAITPLVLWAAHNGVRYGDTTVSRSAALNVPFYPAFRRHEIAPQNGPASRKLARLVEREVLSLPAYRRLNVDASTYLQSGLNYEAVRLWGLVDRVYGLGSDYALLRDAAREVPSRGHVRLRGIDLTIAFQTFRSWLSRFPVHEIGTKPSRWWTPEPTIDVDGKLFPNPEALPPAADAVPYGFLQCASGEIDRCVLEDPRSVLGSKLADRYVEVTSAVREWDTGLGAREPNAWISARLDGLRRRLPRSWIWLAVCVVALAARRPRAWPAVALIAALATLVLAVHAAGGRNEVFFALPLLPAYPVAALCALTAPRRGRES